MVCLMGCTTNPAPEQTAPPTSSPSPESALEDTPLADTPDTSDTSEEAALWEQLRRPDNQLYAVLLRHARAPGTGDPANFQLDDCTTQRNLSEAGREQAVRIGDVFRERGVSVRQVLSSQWCRCLETAELMNLGDVKPFTPLNSFFRDNTTTAAQTAAVQDYLLTQEETPGVVIMVTHQVNITALTDYVPDSGEAVVMEVEDQALTLHGRLTPE